MAIGFFVTGTDTGVGKTLISCALLRGFGNTGKRVVGMKPVAAGAVRTPSGLVSGDALQLCAAANIQAPLELVNPYCFASPIAPHIAATQTGVTISVNAIATAFAALIERADLITVEGIGGFCVPLNEYEDGSHLAVRLGLPIVLVVGMRLGCLNHALLTVRAIADRGLLLAGWIANRIDSRMGEADLNVSTLERRLGAPLLGDIPYDPFPEAAKVATELDLSLLR